MSASRGPCCTSVRVASPRLVSTDWVREICDIADKYCGGHLRFTTRHNVEFLVADEARVEPLLDELAARQLPGGRRGARHQQRGSYPGLDSLQERRDRRLGPGQVDDGRTARLLHRPDRRAGQAAAGRGLLRQHVRRLPLLGHRHRGHSSHRAAGEPRDGRASRAKFPPPSPLAPREPSVPIPS